MSGIQNLKNKLNENLDELLAVLDDNGVDVSGFDCAGIKKDFEARKEREAQQKSEWYYAHRDLIREWFKTPEGKAKKREYDKKYYEKHKKEIALQHKEYFKNSEIKLKRREYMKRYYEAHRDEMLQKQREKRKQKKLNKLSV